MKITLWHTHKWGKWATIRSGNLLHPITKKVLGYYIIQERECLLCGKKELDQQEVT